VCLGDNFERYHTHSLRKRRRGCSHSSEVARGGVHCGGGHTSIHGVSFLGDTASSAERHELTWLSGWLEQSPPAALPNLIYRNFPGLGQAGACVVLLGSGHQPGRRSEASCRWQEPSPALAWSPDGTWKKKSKKPQCRPQYQTMFTCSGLHGGPATGTGCEHPVPPSPPGLSSPSLALQHLLACTPAAFTPSQTQAG